MLKRPIFPCAVGLLAISLALSFGGAAIGLITAAIVAVVSASLISVKIREGLVISALAVTVAVNIIYSEKNTVFVADSMSGSQQNISGTVTEIGFYDNGVNYTVLVNSGKLKNRKVRLSYSGSIAGVGDRINTVSRVYSISDKYTPYYYSNEIFARGKIEVINSVSKGNGIYKTTEKIKNGITDKLFKNMSFDSAATLSAITVGDKIYQSDDFSAAVRASGVSHIMVVSGMHMSIICGSVYFLLKKSFLNHKISVVLAFAVTLGFMLLCGFTPSVVRSGIAYIVMLFGDLIYRKSDGLASLCFAVIIMILLNPFVAGNVGFLLSVASTYGILVIYPLIISRVHIRQRVLSALAEAALISFSALIATLPVSLIFFKTFSPVALLTNICITYAVTVSLVLAAAGTVVSFLPFGSIICRIPFFFADIVTKYYNFIIRLFGSLAV